MQISFRHAKSAIVAAAPVLAALTATPALAHPGHDETATLLAGLSHPLTGIDHILAMVLVGLLAVQLGGRALWLLPTSFVGAMALGSIAGLGGVSPGMVELGIGLSVILLGGMVAIQLRLHQAAAAGLVAVLALFHGHAHGAEAPGGVTLAYLLGFVISTAILHAVGIGAGMGLARLVKMKGPLLLRVLGGLGAGAGIAILAAA